jgi:hypothetical protein
MCILLPEGAIPQVQVPGDISAFHVSPRGLETAGRVWLEPATGEPRGLTSSHLVPDHPQGNFARVGISLAETNGRANRNERKAVHETTCGE